MDDEFRYWTNFAESNICVSCDLNPSRILRDRGLVDVKEVLMETTSGDTARQGVEGISGRAPLRSIKGLRSSGMDTALGMGVGGSLAWSQRMMKSGRESDMSHAGTSLCVNYEKRPRYEADAHLHDCIFWNPSSRCPLKAIPVASHPAQVLKSNIPNHISFSSSDCLSSLGRGEHDMADDAGFCGNGMREKADQESEEFVAGVAEGTGGGGLTTVMIGYWPGLWREIPVSKEQSVCVI
jgi:hypothetical protein